MEFTGPRKRQLFNMVSLVIWIMGCYVTTLLAYFIRDYKHLALAFAAPTVFLLLLYFIPESPRWLASRGRFTEAKVILQKMAAVNRREFPEAMFEEVTREYQGRSDFKEKSPSCTLATPDGNLRENLDCMDTKVKPSRASKKENILSILHYKVLAIRLFICYWNWCANSLTYYGILLYLQNISGSIYVNFSLMSTISLVSNLAAHYFVENFGRKRTYVVFYATCTVASLAVIFPVAFAGKEASGSAVLILTLIGRGCVAVTFMIVYLLTAEMFPTTTRNSVLGTCSVSARIGAAMAPYIADIGMLLGGPMKEALPLLVFGSVGALATVTALLLPETLNKKLPNNIQEAVAMEGPLSNKKRPEPVGLDDATKPGTSGTCTQLLTDGERVL